MLDSLLITENMVSVDDFYQHLEKIDRDKLKHFLVLNQIPNPEIFFQFYDRFLSSKYLNSYRDSHQISYALNRICMRLWPQGLEQNTQDELNSSLFQYLVVLKSDFKSIFNEIELQLAVSAKC
jgi:acyl carrier protein phosphodiesterase